MGMGSKVTIGYKYYMGLHMGLARAINGLLKITADDKTVFDGNLTSSQSVEIDKADLFGGDKKEGGIKGTLQLMMGDADQVAPDGLVSMLGSEDVPGFRNVASLYYDGEVSSMTPYVKPWSIRVWRTSAGWDGNVWYSDKILISLTGDDEDASPIRAMNPAHIIYEALTNRQWGGGIATSRIDSDSFTAAADQLYTEGFGLCLCWKRQDTVANFIQSVLDHIGASLYISRFDGLFHLDLVRDDYTSSDLLLFDEDSGLLGIDADDNSASDSAVNEVIIKWHDPITNDDREWRERNLASIQSIGYSISTTLEYKGIPTVGLAGRVALRELKTRAIGLKRFKLRLDRRAYMIQPGQPLRIKSTARGIESLVVRATKIDTGTNTDGTLTISVVQDVFGLPDSRMASVQSSGWTAPNRTAQAITTRKLVERTWQELAGSIDAANLNLIDSTASYLKALAVKPTSLSLGYVLQDRAGTSGDWNEASDEGEFCPSGLLVTALDYLTTAFSVTSGTDLGFVETGTLLLIDSELCRLDSWNASTQSGTLGRGCVDTIPARHAAGARVWFVADSGAMDASAYTSGTTLQARLLTQTSQEVLDTSLASIDSLTVSARQGRPYPPGNLKLNGSAYPASISGTLTLSWAHRDRLLQADQLIDTTESSIGPETGTTYTLGLYDENGTLRRTETGLTGTSYTWSSEAADSGLASGLNSQLRLRLWAVRDGIQSLQTHDLTITRS